MRMLDRTRIEVAIAREKEKLRLEIGKCESEDQRVPSHNASFSLGLATGRMRALTWILGEIVREDQVEMHLKTPESLL